MISRETRGKRIGSCVKMSALGQKQTCALQNVMSALHPIATTKADFPKNHVRFAPESGHVRCNGGCPLWAKSGLTRCSKNRLLFGHVSRQLELEHSTFG